MEETDWQMKFVGEKQRHGETKEKLDAATERERLWETAYWSLAKAAIASLDALNRRL